LFLKFISALGLSLHKKEDTSIHYSKRGITKDKYKKRKMASKLLLVAAQFAEKYNHETEATRLFIASPDLASSLAAIPDNSMSEARSVGFLPDDETQAQVFRVLQQRAKFSIDEAVTSREGGQALSVDLKIQGFTNTMSAKDPSTGERFVVCQKPEYEIGSKVSVSIAQASSSSSSSSAAVGTWKMATDDLADDGLVDEDELLNDGIVVQRGDAASCGDDGGPAAGKKRACKNCTCGLADMEADEFKAQQAGMTVEDKVIKSSSCGSCYKGDAFRCASCPFLGKPAFEPGQEKVVLSLGSDDI
jgi:hypothetical protein